MSVQNEFDLETSLRRLNELWTFTLENLTNYAIYIMDAKSLFTEIKSNGYKMILADKLTPTELSQLNETGIKTAPDLERIRLKIIELIETKQFNDASILRSEEIRLINEILNDYFGSPSVHFILQDVEKKEILCRPARYKFPYPTFYFDLTTKIGLKQL